MRQTLLIFRRLIVTLAILLVNLVSTGKVWGQVRESNGQNSELNSTFRTSQISKQDLIKVKRIRITGNTVFSDRVLREIVSSVEGKEVTIERILRLRTQLTNYYVDRGYVSSGAFIPSQEYTDGIIEIRIVEGSLAGVEIEGLSHLKKSYILSRLPVLEKPLKISKLIRKLNNFLLVSSLNVQLSSDSLLPIEQITLGGVNSVKGYRQNLSIGDNGVIGNVELQIPLVTKEK